MSFKREKCNNFQFLSFQTRCHIYRSRILCCVGGVLRFVLLQRYYWLVAVFPRDEQFGRITVGALQQYMEHGLVRGTERR